MKHLNILAIPCLALGCITAACSSDDDNNAPSTTGNEIKFSVVAPATPRVAHVETTTESIKTFLLNAFTNKNTFMDNLTVNRVSGNPIQWDYGTPVYWPANPVNFYAVSPDIRTSSVGVKDNSFSMNYDNTGSVDLLYSVAYEQTQSSMTDPQPVKLNFRHALSRVAVLMSSTNSNFKVHVNKVEFENILQSGQFTFPQATTAAGTSVSGTWANQSDLDDADIWISNGKTTENLLTIDAREFSNLNYSFAMPQTLAIATSVASGEVEGSYIKVECEIVDQHGNTLWPNAKTPEANKENGKGIIRFPLCKDNQSMNWEAGIAYIYNIKINELPGLEPIDFTVTVDEINYDGNKIEINQ